uniref:Ig-like domain-containing protein n=1 Tax=Lates calcarifer TaxID=8187 RepID=A0A4W6BTV8_LATCA
MVLSLALTATPEGLGVRQYPPFLSVMRGETATLSCHFKVESLKYGVQWFKMKPEKQLILKSSRHSFEEENQTSSLVITGVAPEDSGRYYCEVNVLQMDPERGNGTELVVSGEKQIVGFINEHARNSLEALCLGDVCHAGNYVSFVSSVHQTHSTATYVIFTLVVFFLPLSLFSFLFRLLYYD